MELTLLRHLSLSENFICNEGFKNICYKAKWPQIQNVDLSKEDYKIEQNFIKDMFELADGNWPNLLFVNLGRWKIIQI